MLLLRANLGSCVESLSPHSICQESHKGLPSSRGKEKLIGVWQVLEELVGLEIFLCPVLENIICHIQVITRAYI